MNEPLIERPSKIGTDSNLPEKCAIGPQLPDHLRNKDVSENVVIGPQLPTMREGKTEAVKDNRSKSSNGLPKLVDVSLSDADDGDSFDADDIDIDRMLEEPVFSHYESSTAKKTVDEIENEESSNKAPEMETEISNNDNEADIDLDDDDIDRQLELALEQKKVTYDIFRYLLNHS